MSVKLVVIQPFASYQPGDEITNPADVDAIIDSDHEVYVVKVAVPDTP